jgi:hypothetical protein
MAQFLTLSNVSINTKYIIKIDIKTNTDRTINEYIIYYQTIFRAVNGTFNMKYDCVKVGIRSPDFQIVADFLHPPCEVANMTNECASAPIVQASACAKDF